MAPDQLLAVLDSVARVVDRLEERAKALEDLLHQADERIRLLGDALDHTVAASISPAKAATNDGRRESTTAVRLDPFAASVYELADRGRSPVEIAQCLHEQVGKVELVLALRQRA